MRPNHFNPHQGGPRGGGVPQNPQMMMQQRFMLQRQQVMHQQRVLRHQLGHQSHHQSSQASSLNAAIRELQQKTQQNQRHPLRSPSPVGNPHPPPHQFQHPMIRLPTPAPNRIPGGFNNPPPPSTAHQNSPAHANMPGPSIIRPGAPLNPNVHGPNNFLNQLPPLNVATSSPACSMVPHPANAFNRIPPQSPGILPVPPSNNSPHDGSSGHRSPGLKSSNDYGSGQDRRCDKGGYRGRDDSAGSTDRSLDRGLNPRRANSYSGRDRDRYDSYSDSKSRRSRSRSRERRYGDEDRSRATSRDDRSYSRYRDEDSQRDRDKGRSRNGLSGNKEARNTQSGDRMDNSGRHDDYRDKGRPMHRDDRRSESVRSDRSSRSTAAGRSDSRASDRDRDQRSRSRRRDDRLSPSSTSSPSSYSRHDRGGHSRSNSGNRRTTEDTMGGMSQYRVDLMRAEMDRNMLGSDGGNSDFLSKRINDGLLDEEKWDPDMKLEDEDVEEDTTVYITRSCPADLYFNHNAETGNMDGTKKMAELEKRFEEDIVKKSEKVRAAIPESELPAPPPHIPHFHNHHKHSCSCDHNKSNCCERPGSTSSDSSSSEEEGEANDDDDDDDDDEGSANHMTREWERRSKHPLCLHPELWYNEPGQVNDGPLCRCSIKSRKSGIRHDIYPGEEKIPPCLTDSNNLDRLHHYRVTMSPYTNFLTKRPTLIEYDNHEYIFEGFSLFTHTPLENIPPCKLLRFNIEYTIHFIPESPPENFTVGSLDLFSDYIFTEVLELLDLDWGVKEDGCRRFHFMPRFCRSLPDSGCKEVLSMNTVLNFLIKSSKPLVDESRVKQMMSFQDDSWKSGVGAVRGMIVTKPGMKPSSVRIDQLDRNISGRSSNKEEEKAGRVATDAGDLLYPLIIHQGYRPAQLSYAGDPLYRRAWKQYIKFRHLLNSKPKITPKDKQRLKELEDKLQDICFKKTMKREVTVELNAKGFLCTGLRADLCQHALMVPVLMSHLRFHICLDVLEEQINYKFKDRTLLQLALTHTSYRTNYGTNPDHTRNSLTNCGMRQVEYGDRRVHYQNTRKRGICILLDIMSRFGKQEETVSDVPHNERLEFLGDAVIEFLTSVHLFFMFPWLEEGGLSTYRMALVQNHHLTQLAKKLKLQDFMLYVHGPDLCHESDLRHAMANCCEALMGSLFLDGGLEVVDSIFSKTLFDEENVLLHTWVDLPKHVLQQAEPAGDRHWVKSVPVLQKLESFEESIGVKFSHIRLLAKSFTHRNIGYNPLTMGHNQRLEFLGDTVLQLVASEYLYRHYPEHHEGHLSLLRSSLVNSRTQAMVYDDLNMSQYVIFNEGALADGLDMKTKQRADMLEAFIGALYVDKGLDYCWAFCNVCFFPRLKDFIVNQDWNDPKSQLQQCCLTLREVGGGEPDIPIYKMIESIGPTNSRKYVVAVYFRGRRLATGTGHTIQQSQMDAATNALKKRAELFPILQHQRRYLEKMKQGFFGKLDGEGEETGGGDDNKGGAAGGSFRKNKLSPRKRHRGVKGGREKRLS